MNPVPLTSKGDVLDEEARPPEVRSPGRLYPVRAETSDVRIAALIDGIESFDPFDRPAHHLAHGNLFVAMGRSGRELSRTVSDG